MRNKRIRTTLAALLATIVCMGGFSMTAYAGGDEISTDDSGVVIPQPLTPEGNMTLVDDIEGEAAEDKQFITVVSKSGNYFYIIIDRSSDGENTVHFLNQVDESDLMAIIGEEEPAESPAPVVCHCVDKCMVGAIDTSCPVCSVTMGDCDGKEIDPEPQETDPPMEKKSGGMGGVLVLLLLAAAGGGGAFYYFKVLKPKQSVKGNDSFDDWDFEDEEEEEVNEDEEEANGDNAANEQEDIE